MYAILDSFVNFQGNAESLSKHVIDNIQNFTNRSSVSFHDDQPVLASINWNASIATNTVHFVVKIPGLLRERTLIVKYTKVRWKVRIIGGDKYVAVLPDNRRIVIHNNIFKVPVVMGKNRCCCASAPRILMPDMCLWFAPQHLTLNGDCPKIKKIMQSNEAGQKQCVVKKCSLRRMLTKGCFKTYPSMHDYSYQAPIRQDHQCKNDDDPSGHFNGGHCQ